MFFLNNGFPVSLLLVFIIFLFYLWYTFSIMYHFIRFGIGKEPKTLSLIFFIGSFILFVIAVTTYTRIDWQIIFNKLSYVYLYFLKK